MPDRWGGERGVEARDGVMGYGLPCVHGAHCRGVAVVMPSQRTGSPVGWRLWTAGRAQAWTQRQAASRLRLSESDGESSPASGLWPAAAASNPPLQHRSGSSACAAMT